MSVISGKEESARKEEIKRKLKSKPLLPQVKVHRLKEVSAQRIQLAIKAKTSIATVTTEEHLPLKLGIQLSPITIKAMKPALRELKEVVYSKSMESAMPKATAKIASEAETIAELKPKTPKVEAEVLKISKLSKINVLARLPPEAGLKISLRPIRQVVLEPIRMPVVKPPRVVVKPTLPVAPKQTEKVLITEGAKESAKPMREKSPEISEEEIFVPPFLEKLSLASKPMGRPVCIVLSKRENDSFVHSVALICREIYRIVKGGKPEPRWISKGLKDEIERHLRAEDMIFVVDDSRCEFLPDFGRIRFCTELLEKVDMDVVLDRLREFFSQEFGFTIFHVNERWASQFARMLEEKVGTYVDIVYVPSPDWQPQIKVAVARVCWGFIEGEGRTFDEIFGRCEKEFFDELGRVSGDVKLTHWIKEDENAGYEHEGMKAIVVECLAKELGATCKDDVVRMLKDGVIETEHELSSGGRVDVYLRTSSIQKFVEIETFYGRGDPVKRLDKDTLSKYKEAGVSCIDIVLLTGVQALLYARRLIELVRIYRKEHGLTVNFHLPNIRERKLVPLRDVFHMLKDAIGPSKLIEELTADDVERLWSEFSQALRECGMDPEEYKRLFNLMLDRSKSYQDNLSYILEEIKLFKEGKKEA